MALAFNDTTNENGLCQEIDSICGTNSTTYPLKQKARRLNNALDQYFQLTMKSCGNWSVGDSNATDRPEATTNLVSGQKDYALDTSMLVIESIWVKDSGGSWHALEADNQDVNGTITGLPTKYRKFERSIIFNKTPDYSSTGGIKIFYQRTLARFTSTDTTKTAGIPAIHDFYLARVSALPWLIEKGKSTKNDIASLIQKDEEMIKSYFSLRERDVRRRLLANVDDCR